MAGEKNFNVKNGLSVGGVEVINSSGDLVAAGVGTAVNEAIADKIGGIISATGGATATYNDGADTIVIDVPITDEDNMASNSATAIPSQQSVKAYVDSQILTKDNTDEITEGSSNLYHTTERVQDVVGALVSGSGSTSVTYDDAAGTMVISSTGKTTEEIQDIVGGMVSSNTESGITVAYEDGDGTIDFTVGTLNQDTTGTADNITVTANNSTDETVYPVFVDGATGSQGAESDTGLTYNPSSGLLTTTSVAANLTGNVTGNVSGSAGSATGNAATATALQTARTIHGVSFDGTGNIDLTEVVQDTVGAMFTGNTETNIAVTYEDGDGTIDLVVGDTTGNAATATALETARAIAVSGDVVGTANFDGTAGISISTTIQANSVALGTDTTGDYVGTITGGTGVTSTAATSGEGTTHSLSIGQDVSTSADVTFADIAATDLTLSGNLTVNGTTTTAASTNTVITDRLIELGNGTSGTPANDMGLVFERGSSDNVFIGWDESADVVTIGTGSFTGASTGDLTHTVANFTAGVGTFASLDISGNADIDGTMEADAYTVDGTALNEYIADTVGAMVSSNTESGITVAYEDGDNTLDFTIGTLNQDTTGLAGTATALATARTIGGVSFDGTANINLPGVNTSGNQNTSGTSAGLSGTPNISVGTIASGAITITNATNAGGTARNIYQSTSAPGSSDGAVGDLWVLYS